MSTRPEDVPVNFPNRFTAPDADYPDGSAKNDTTGVAGDGTPFEKAMLNDIYGEQQAKLALGGIVPSGNSETVLASDQVDAMRRFTILPYVATLDYLVNGYTRGSDGNLYQCLVANGPSSTVVDPTVDIVGFWVLVTPKNPRDNLLINGDFQVAQRGTNFTPDDGIYTLDRWRATRSGSAFFVASQDADIPTQSESSDTAGFSLKLDVTTSDASIGSTEYNTIGQPVEGYNIKHLLNREITLSFWVKATKTGVYCAAFRNSGKDRSYVVEFTIDSSDTWEKKSITITLHDGASGTWDFTNGIGLTVDFVLAAGTNFHTAPDVWQTGDFIATANQVNGVDSLSNDFRVALVKLEAGNGPTAFKHRPFGEELALCQRYFEKSYNVDVVPGTVTTNGIMYVSPGRGGSAPAHIGFNTLKRATPSMTAYNPNTLNLTGSWRDVTAGADRTISFGFVGEQGGGVTIVAAADGNAVQGHWTAESEL